jgi:hypothetical protein
MVSHYIQWADALDGGGGCGADVFGPSVQTEMTVSDGKLWFDGDDIPLDLQLVRRVELK